MAGISIRFSFATVTTIQQLRNSSNNEDTVKSTALWLSVCIKLWFYFICEKEWQE